MTVQFSSSASGAPREMVQERLADYFAQLGAAFAEAAKRSPGADSRRNLAGGTVRIAIAGTELAAAVMPALAHLSIVVDRHAPQLEILAWDEYESGVSLPPPPWSRPDYSGNARIVLPQGIEAFRVHAPEDGTIFMMFSAEAKTGIFWIRDARRLPNHDRAAPFFAIWHWWAPTAGLRVLHAGCVGTDAGAALLVGAGGSGKSTTALLCAMADLHYLGDDFSLIRLGAGPMAYCLFNSGKLHRDHLRQFPELLARAMDPVPDPLQKPMILVHRDFPERVVAQLPVRAVVSPVVTDRPQTRVIPLSAAKALRALAPSTLFLMPGENATAFHDMAELVRALPCFRLELGARTRDIAPAVRSILDAMI